jgi:hypothetical protein
MITMMTTHRSFLLVFPPLVAVDFMSVSLHLGRTVVAFLLCSFLGHPHLPLSCDPRLQTRCHTPPKSSLHCFRTFPLYNVPCRIHRLHVIRHRALRAIFPRLYPADLPARQEAPDVPLRDHRISVLDARTVFVVAQGIMSPGSGQLGDPSGSPRNGREQRAPSSSSERLREGVMAERVV